MTQTPEGNSKSLIERLRRQHDSAAEDVVAKYVQRLTALVRSQMAARLARKFDPEDVVQSAFRSFFVAARNGRLHTDENDSLWRILVTFTLRKLYRSIDEFSAAKRDIALEFDQSSSLVDPLSLTEHAVILEDEIENLLRSRSNRDRRVLEMLLQGNRQTEIADAMKISERTVRRILEGFKSSYEDDKSPLPENSATIESAQRIDTQFPTFPAKLKTISLDELIIKRHVGSGGAGKVYLAEIKKTMSKWRSSFFGSDSSRIRTLCVDS